VGTGLSYTKKNDGYANSDAAVNDHFYKFLTGFFNLHDRFTYMKDGKRFTRKFFISGESHAGHYIPSMAAFIRQKNAATASSTSIGAGQLFIDIQGIALGNPWIDPMNQYDVSDFAHGLGIISHGQRNRLKEMERQCQNHLKQGKFNTKVCFDLLDDVVDSSSLPGSLKVLMYDARKYVTHTQVFPPGHEAVEKYLNRPDVRVAIHATSTPHKYVECADPPFNALSHQDGKGVTKELVEILDSGLRVLVYSGQFDLICHHLGTEKALQNLAWSGQGDWLKAQPGVWIINKQPAGYMKAFKNLQYLLGE
jgi:carboxypeptidase C (cathepsin A)